MAAGSLAEIQMKKDGKHIGLPDLVRYRDREPTSWRDLKTRISKDPDAIRQLLDSRVLKATLATLSPRDDNSDWEEAHHPVLESYASPTVSPESRELGDEPDDVKLLSYLLDDLNPDQAEQIEQGFRNSPDTLANLLRVRNLIDSNATEPEERHIESFASLNERVKVGSVFITALGSQLSFRFVEPYLIDPKDALPPMGFQEDVVAASMTPPGAFEHDLEDSIFQTHEPSSRMELLSQIENEIRAIGRVFESSHRDILSLQKSTYVIEERPDVFDKGLRQFGFRISELQRHLEICLELKDRLQSQGTLSFDDRNEHQKSSNERRRKHVRSFGRPALRKAAVTKAAHIDNGEQEVKIAVGNRRILISGRIGRSGPIIDVAISHRDTKLPEVDADVTLVEPSVGFDTEVSDENGRVSFRLPTGRSTLLFQLDHTYQIQLHPES